MPLHSYSTRQHQHLSRWAARAVLVSVTDRAPAFLTRDDWRVQTDIGGLQADLQTDRDTDRHCPLLPHSDGSPLLDSLPALYIATRKVTIGAESHLCYVASTYSGQVCALQLAFAVWNVQGSGLLSLWSCAPRGKWGCGSLMRTPSPVNPAP